MIKTNRYATTVDGVYIAYQVVGDGPIDLVWQFDVVGNADTVWEHPGFASWYGGLASFSRLILFDQRATGLSSRNVAPSNLETREADLRAVLDAVGSRSVVLGGFNEGGASNILFAAHEPDRVRSIVWWSPSARTTWAPDYPWGGSPEYLERSRQAIAAHWGTDEYGTAFADAERAIDHLIDPEVARTYGKLSRNTTTPDVAIELERIWAETDIRGILPAVQAPALLMWLDAEGRDETEYIASLMPNARAVFFEGDVESAPQVQAPALDSIRRFMGIDAPPSEMSRVLSTVLFTDIVDATARQVALGDVAWKALVLSHHALVRDALERWRGVENDTAGDGFYATFDGPARAIRCAMEVCERVRALGIEIRAGIHTGECEIIDGKYAGIAVTIGARVAARAGASEVLVSQTVKDLVAGSGLVFEDAGEHELKGLSDRRRLFRAAAEPG